MDADRPAIIWSGCNGYLLDAFDDYRTVEMIKLRAERAQNSFMATEQTVVSCAHESNGYLWLPRFFDPGVQLDGWDEDQTTMGEAAHFSFIKKPLESRGQVEATETMIAYLKDHSGGILRAFTGAGKTFMSLWIAAQFGRKIGIVVHKKHQVKDWVKEILETFHLSRDDIGIVQGKHCNLGRPITIMMCGSLISNRRYPQRLYEQFGFICCDEVHRYGAPEWNKVFYQFPAYYRLGLSATPERGDGLDDIVNWHFGEEGYGLDKPGGLKKPTVYQFLYCVEYDQDDYFNAVLGCNDANSYYRLLMADEARNRLVVLNIVRARRKKRTILVLTHRKAHVVKLHAMIQEAVSADGDCPRTEVTIIMGGAKDHELDKAKRSGIIISTFHFLKESYNDKRIDTLVFAMPPGKVEQPLGRLRDVEVEGKADDLICLDFYELGDYSDKKAGYRRGDFARLGVPVKIKRAQPLTENEFWDQITPKRFDEGKVKGNEIAKADTSWFGGDD